MNTSPLLRARVLSVCLSALTFLFAGCGGGPTEASDASVDGMLDAARDTASCVPTTCEELGQDCGVIFDGCGRSVPCGRCDAPEFCGGGGPGLCGGCQPATCGERRAQCGALDDGCGGELDCGECAAGRVCGGGGEPNVCECVVRTCGEAGAECGNVDNGCGVSLYCGRCHFTRVCIGETGVCCLPSTCGELGVECGEVADGCGGTVDCGETCAAPETCAGAGVPNECGCTPIDCDGRCGTVDDGCGTPIDCGCSDPDRCGGSWAADRCGVNTSLECTPEGWCRVAEGATDGFFAVWGSSATDVWAAGEFGILAHFDGDRWTVLEPIWSGDVFQIGGTSATDVWAVGDEAWHFDGTSWEHRAHPGEEILVSLYAAAPDDVWLLGDFSGMLRWNGAEFSTVPAFTARTVEDLWGFGADDLYTVGGLGEVSHYDGASWSIPYEGRTDLWRLWGSAPDNMWACGYQGYVARRDVTGWVDVPRFGLDTLMLAVWGAGADDVWFSTGDSRIHHHGGGVWTDQGVVLANERAHGLWASSPSDLWAVGWAGGVTHFDGSDWTVHSQGAFDTTSRADIWVGNSRSVWLEAGQEALWRFDGVSQRMADLPLENVRFWDAGPTEAWLVGYNRDESRGEVHRYDGSTWSLFHTTIFAPRAIAGRGPGSDVWVVGSGARAEVLSAGTWRSGSVPAGSVADLYVAPGGEGWGLAIDGRIWERSGDTWTATSSISGGATMRRLWGASASEVWAVGSPGVYRYRAGTWALVDTGATSPLRDVEGTSTGEIWAVGDDDSVLHWDGATWTNATTGFGEDLLAVDLDADGEPFIAGSDGRVIFRRE